MLIQELPEQDRPREKLAKRGSKALTEAELIAIFLRVGGQGYSAIDLGHALLKSHGSLAALARCSVAELAKTKGIGGAKAAQLVAAFEMGNRLAAETISEVKLEEPQQIYRLLATEMRALRQESVRVVLLNTRMRLIKVEEITRGTLNESLLSPREVLRPALIHSAYAIALVHNHPSGDPSPSNADVAATRKIVRAAQNVDVRFIDHIIVGAPNEEAEPYFSFRENSFL